VLLELRGWRYHGTDGAKPAVWMYLVLLVRRASSVLYSYNLIHRKRKIVAPPFSLHPHSEELHLAHSSSHPSL